MNRNDILVTSLTTDGRRRGVIPNTGWTNEARAASIAVRQAKAAERAKARGTNPKWDEKPGDGWWTRLGKKMARDFSRNDPPPDPPPPPPEPKTPRDKMFSEQAKRAGKDFLGNWYPRGEDGKNADPRFGDSTPEAPYGYVEGTKTPRKEPLYDQWGRPIIPRAKRDWFEADVAGFGWLSHDYGMDRANVWIKKVDEAKAKWGPFGQKKKFMDAHPGATDKDWEAYDQTQYRKRKGAKSGKSASDDGEE